MGSNLLYSTYLCLFLTFPYSAFSGDSDALISLKSALDTHNRLPWRREFAGEVCTRWPGVKQCSHDGRVIKLVLEFLNLTGTLTTEYFTPLNQIRVLSFKSNSISGEIPNLSVLRNLKSLYLNDNLFSGQIPASLTTIRRLKTIVLSNNHLSGNIPLTFTSIHRLYSLQLQANRLTGTIPAFNQSTLRFLNLSENDFSGELPSTIVFSHFNESSFRNNPSLCGTQIERPCSHSNRNRKRFSAIIAGSVAALLLLLTVLGLIILSFLKKKNSGRSKEINEINAIDITIAGVREDLGGEKSGFSWEADGIGKLVFVGGVNELYSLEDLLRASAETLGRGSMGSTYKAVMESGFVVTVKRLTDRVAPPSSPAEFRQKMEELGLLHHPNLVSLRAYFQAKEERLIVYDYYPNGSLFSLIHGSHPNGEGKPMHWTSCLKIAEDVASGLHYLHHSGVVHGNLKSSNVLLGPEFESRLTDYALLHLPHSDPSASSSSSLSYRAPECRNPLRHSSPPSDVYSFGVLLLELLTGRIPFHDLIDRHGSGIPAWVRAVRDDEKETVTSGDEPSASSGGDVEDRLAAMLGIVMACLAGEPEARPNSKEVVRIICEVRAASASSNSSG